MSTLDKAKPDSGAKTDIKKVKAIEYDPSSLSHWVHFSDGKVHERSFLTKELAQKFVKKQQDKGAWK